MAARFTGAVGRRSDVGEINKRLIVRANDAKNRRGLAFTTEHLSYLDRGRCIYVNRRPDFDHCCTADSDHIPNESKDTDLHI